MKKILMTVMIAIAAMFALTSCGAKLKSITAKYNAIPNPGNLISGDAIGLSVTAHYGDGSEKVIDSGWTVKNPGRLVAGETSTFTIEYKGMTCELKITASTNKVNYNNLGTRNVTGPRPPFSPF
jgi:uncharacterized lipoprotein YehR (DUF1307 family)